MVLTVDNVQESRRAYFGISDDETEGSKFSAAHHSPAYAVVSSAATVPVMPVMPPNNHPRDYVDSNAKYEAEPGLADDSSYLAQNTGSSASQQHTSYKDPSSLVFAKEVFEDPSDPNGPASVVVDIGPGSKNSTIKFVRATADEIAPSDAEEAEANPPTDSPVDTSVAASVDTAQVSPESAQDLVPEQPEAATNYDDTSDASVQDSDSTYTGGLQTVPQKPLTWSLRNVTRGVYLSCTGCCRV